MLGRGDEYPVAVVSFRRYGSSPWLQKQHLLAPPALLAPGRLLTLKLLVPVVSLPLAKGSLSRAGPVPSAVTLVGAGVELAWAKHAGTMKSPSPAEEVLRGYISSIS